MPSPSAPHPHVLLIGCGHMGTALLRGWGSDKNISVSVVDPSPLAADLLPLVHWSGTNLAALPQGARFDMVVLAVKPQQMDTVLNDLKTKISPDTPVLSIAAGRTISGIADLLHPNTVIIRAMPNLPAAIGQGMTAVFTPSSTTNNHKQLATHLLSPTGDVIWVDHEDRIDAVTALSGSGPAYVFLLVEVLAQAGVNLGLPPDLAMRLARGTLTGSAALLAQKSEFSARDLRTQVTSPGGTTEAALKILIGDAGTTPEPLQALFNTALTAAHARAKELKR